MADERGIKIVLLGESGVGKTNLIRVAMNKPFEKNENSTISSSYHEDSIVINNKQYLYYLWDTAGQEIYRSLNKIFIKESKIVMIVFAINNKASYEEVDFWIEYTKEILGENKYILALVANKSDLYENQEIPDKEFLKKAEDLHVKIKITSAAEDAVGFKEFLKELLNDYVQKFGAESIKDVNAFKIEDLKDDKNNEKKKKGCC